MELRELKPLLTALAMPPASPLLLALLGLLWMRRRRVAGALLAVAGIATLWLLSCNGMAVLLGRYLLPAYAPVTPAALRAQPVQAVVVLGGGLFPEAPEYGEAQLNSYTAPRLRYGAWLSRQLGVPLAYAGGIGWATAGVDVPPEGDVARRVAREDYGIALRWVDDRSRDTAENGRFLAPLLQRDGVRRIALVTHAWHMPRSVDAFRRAGLEVVPAPMGFVAPLDRPLLEWLPSGQGLQSSRLVLREWLGLRVGPLAR